MTKLDSTAKGGILLAVAKNISCQLLLLVWENKKMIYKYLDAEKFAECIYPN